MDLLFDLSWRVYPASALMVLGSVLALWGLRMEWMGLYHALRTDPARILGFLHGFRLSVIGLALVGIGAAWNWHIAVLLALALIIGGEETLESSVHIYAVRRGRRLAEARTAGTTSPKVPVAS